MGKKETLPPRILILETLEDKGRLYEAKLKEILEEAYEEFSRIALNEELMRLEAAGLILVKASGRRKGKIIELLKERKYTKIGED